MISVGSAVPYGVAKTLTLRFSQTRDKCQTLYNGQFSYLVGWCFEPSQTRRIISGLKTNFNLSPSYSVSVNLKMSHFVKQLC